MSAAPIVDESSTAIALVNARFARGHDRTVWGTTLVWDKARATLFHDRGMVDVPESGLDADGHVHGLGVH